MAQDPHAARTPGALHRKLDVFVGRWHVEGKNLGQAPNEPDTPVSGEETYELLVGGFFLSARFEHVAAGGSKHAGTSVIGVEDEALRCDNFDNLGYHRTYALRAEGNVWTFTGEHERAVQTFAADGKSFEIEWELSKDGKRWQPLCRLRGAKR